MSAADLQKAIGHYRNLAPRYDYFTRRINRIRYRTVAALSHQLGETVLDAGCGTGYCFQFIEQAIGREGKLMALEPLPYMLTIARNRLAESQWEIPRSLKPGQKA